MNIGMNIQEIDERVAQIAAAAWHVDLAHDLEAQLRRDVLEAIADGVDNPAEMAAAVLKTTDIDFPRYHS